MKKTDHVHVVGVSGAEGSAITLFLAERGYKNVTLHDFCAEKEFAKMFYLYHQELDPAEKMKQLKTIKSLPYKFCYRENYLEEIEQADVVFLPQSWYLYAQNKPIKHLKNVELKSLMQLYLELAKATIIGVTGSNGKTTTTNLIKHILKKCNKNVFLAGNDRGNKQILEKIEGLDKNAFLILEISNRHLKMTLPKSPHIAVITNISQNHLLEHDSFEDYIKTKLNILSLQTKADFAVLNAKNKNLYSVNTTAKKILFGGDNPSYRDYLAELDWKKIKLSGDHNRQNIEAALAVAYILKLDKKKVLDAVLSFEPVKKRLEKIFEYEGITFINDLSSTTPESTIRAIESFPNQEITLIIGGDNKGLDLSELAEKIEEKVKTVIYHDGTVAEELVPQLKNTRKIHALDIEGCIKAAYKETIDNSVVLFSPVGEKYISGVLKNRDLKKMLVSILK